MALVDKKTLQMARRLALQGLKAVREVLADEEQEAVGRVHHERPEPEARDTETRPMTEPKKPAKEEPVAAEQDSAETNAADDLGPLPEEKKVEGTASASRAQSNPWGLPDPAPKSQETDDAAALEAALSEVESYEEEDEDDDFDPRLMMSGYYGGFGAQQPHGGGLQPYVEEMEVDPKAPRDEQVVTLLKGVYDPEIPVNIYELGLVYGVEVDEDGGIDITMTLTSPNCPAAQSLPQMVQETVAKLEWCSRSDVDVVFDPPWGPEKMTEEARLELNLI